MIYFINLRYRAARLERYAELELESRSL
jgi:hypothetical protein